MKRAASPLAAACLVWLATAPAAAAPAAEPVAASVPAYLPEVRFHLTARPWQAVDQSVEDWLGPLDAATHAMAPLQYWNASDANDKLNGAILDPFDKKELQYGTPLFAFNVAALLSFGCAADLAEAGARALDRATLDISDGPATDWHGEFFTSPMVKAIRLFEAARRKHPAITAARLKTWKERMQAKRTTFMNMKVKQNWRTFAMKGEWLRQQDGFIADGVRWIEANWTEAAEGGQRERFRRDLDKYGLEPHFFLYHDDTADPETFAYNGATTANLLDMLENGYNGPSAAEIRRIVEHNLRSSLLLVGGSGEAPAGGRTGEHIWDDTIYAYGFERMAGICHRNGDLRGAGQFRRAAQLLLASHERFQQENGWFSITKNQFHPSLKNRYASWSGIANYEGLTLSCAFEALLARKMAIAEQPTPAEIGGYAVTLAPSFANVFLNAGGMQAQLCLRGETDKYGGVQWHTLGVTRFSRAGWDSRPGPGAGHVRPDFSDGFSFSPVFKEDGKWARVCLQPKRFAGSFRPQFVHPLLVRGSYTIAPVAGQSGPTFVMAMTLTPDGVLVDTTCPSGADEFGVLWPLLEFDGRTVLDHRLTASTASTSYPRLPSPSVLLKAGQASIPGGVGAAVRVPSPSSGPGGARLMFPTPEAAVEWTGIEGGDGGPTAIGFGYALGLDAKATRRARVSVNGKFLPDLVFPSTGGWNNWHQLRVPVTLAPGGGNVIRVEGAEGPDAVVIDELEVHPARTATAEPDQQNFIALAPTHQLDATDPAVRGGYGDFRPVRVTDSKGGPVGTFVYPRNAGDPLAESVRASFVRDGQDFSSVLGRVRGTLYVGRTSAGGEGKAIDLDRDGKDDATFDQSCAFVLQLHQGAIRAVEADRPVVVSIAGKQRKLAPFTPVRFKPD